MDRYAAMVRFLRLLGPQGGRVALETFQGYLLQRTLRHAARHSPFYRRAFAEYGVHPQMVRSIHDLPRLGFMTKPDDLRRDPSAFLAVPWEDVVYLASSSGTTGRSKTVFFTRQDWDVVAGGIAAGLRFMGLSRRDVVQILYCYGEPAWMTGSLLQDSLARLGALVVPAGNACPIEQQLALMRTYGTTVLCGTPSYLHRLTEQGQKLADLRALGVRWIFLGAEPWSEALRAYLQRAWGAAAYDSYGMTEMGLAGAGECVAQQGLHLVGLLALEVIEPATGRPLPPGEEGELVVTTLGRKASPLIRYRTGDVAALLPDQPCPCGGFTPRISRIRGRTDDMICVGTGENLCPADLDLALAGLPGVSGYQLVVGQEGYRDTLLLRVETAAPSPDLEQAVVDRLYHTLGFLRHDVRKSQTIAEPTIELIAPGTLRAHNPIKLRRIADLRHVAGPVPAGRQKV